MRPLAMLSQCGVDGSRHSWEAPLTHHLLSHLRKAFSSTLAFLQVGVVPAPRNQLVRLVGGLHDVSPGTLDKPRQAETDLLLRHHRQKILAIRRVIWGRRRAITERGNPRPAPIIILHWQLFSFGILLGEFLSIDLHQIKAPSSTTTTAWSSRGGGVAGSAISKAANLPDAFKAASSSQPHASVRSRLFTDNANSGLLMRKSWKNLFMRAFFTWADRSIFWPL